MDVSGSGGDVSARCMLYHMTSSITFYDEYSLSANIVFRDIS
jgi:hypothetical protein